MFLVWFKSVLGLLWFRYGLKSNDAVIATEAHMPLFKEIEEQFKAEYFAGGATQNSIKVAQVCSVFSELHFRSIKVQ